MRLTSLTGRLGSTHDELAVENEPSNLLTQRAEHFLCIDGIELTRMVCRQSTLGFL
jgi:hypothetical protein